MKTWEETIYRLEYTENGGYCWHFEFPDKPTPKGWKQIGLGTVPQLTLFVQAMENFFQGKSPKTLGVTFDNIFDWFFRYKLRFKEKVLDYGENKNQIEKVCNLTWNKK
jgi:hypothetical protein